MPIPFIRPNPPRLSALGEGLKAIEASGIFSNFGPVNAAFEQDMLQAMFGGEGGCVTTCNATIALMLAIQEAIGDRPEQTRYALMPSFTFAATAQAALWCGLTPLFCDIDPVTWAPSAADEERLLDSYGDRIAVIVPYATFGYDIDLERYAGLTERYGVPVVVDAAASLGTRDAQGRGFGTGFMGSIVYSMHTTKAFSTSEGGLIYSGDEERIKTLRLMSNYGFGEPRVATMPGLNGKLSETAALICRERLRSFADTVAHRSHVMERYRMALPELVFQPAPSGQQSHQFGVALLPPGWSELRGRFLEVLAKQGIGHATYFSPHLAQHSFFQKHALFGALPVTDSVASRVICLPMNDTMTEAEIDTVIEGVKRAFGDCRPYTPASHAYLASAMAAD
jgi:dTDP-4-amino-4,6-dideoxygalactose transaminase